MKSPTKINDQKRETRALLQQFLRRLQEAPPSGLQQVAAGAAENAWRSVSCLSCASCCRHMSPRYTPTDLKRIALHLRMSPKLFKKKWLYQDRLGNWLNRSQPCPFLNVDTNKCSIYAIRPADCAAFPHLAAMPLEEHVPTYAQNVSYCPATERFVEGLYERIQEMGIEDY